jgi:calcineurin-like phosphoesterase family protein
VFAQAKNAQQEMEASVVSEWELTRVVPQDQLYILDQFKGTAYQKDVYSNCLYYSDYHN